MERRQSKARLGPDWPWYAWRHTVNRAHTGRPHSKLLLAGWASLVGCLVVMALMPGVASFPTLNPEEASAEREIVGSITLAPEGAFCRHLALDNRTGVLSDRGYFRCIERGFSPISRRMADGRFEGFRGSFLRR